MTTMNKRKSYSEMMFYESFDERLEYLRLRGSLGNETFGIDRYLNQALYRSPEWKQTRSKVILRDSGCDLGIEDLIIYGKALVHHINPITIEDIESRNELIFDMENLITVSHNTHNLIHYGKKENKLIERTAYDTCPWKRS